MKKLILVFLVIAFLTIPKNASAHLVGQPPFFKINNEFSILYPVPTTSLADFNLPQDIATKNYTLGQTLDFEIDTSQLPIPQEVVKQTTFEWDYGDGNHGSGLKNSYSYKKSGSFILAITAKYQDQQPQLIQSVLMNVLPDQNYKLPKAVIKINGRQSKDPLTDVLNFSFKKEINFDGSASETGSSKIVSYFWDFGEVNSGEGVKVTHKYAEDLSQVFPVLRIKDENGFIADSFVEIVNKEGDNSSDNDNASQAKPTANNLTYFVIGGFVILVVVGVLLSRRKRK